MVIKSRGVHLTLASRAIESRPPGLGNAFDPARPFHITITAGAGLTLAAIDGKAVLEITELAGRLHMVAQARTPGGDGIIQDLADGAGEVFRLRPLGGNGDAMGLA